MRFGYYVDLSSIKLSDDNKSWVHAMPIGEYSHPVYGKLSFTADRVKKFADSVTNRVRGIDLDIDYDHKARTSEAAGWVKAAEARPNGLWLLVEWTKAAAEKIRDKAYRYFSPEFLDKWTDPKGAQHTDVLCGGGITNRPFLKGDLVPVNLSELDAVSFTEKEKELDGKELRKKLGLPEDATDDQVMQKVEDLKTSAGTQGNPTHPVTGDALPANTNIDPRNSQPHGAPSVDASVDHNTNPFLSEAALKQLSEANPTIKALVEAHANQQKQLAEVQHALKLSEVTRKVGSYNTAQQVIAPAAAELIRDVMMLSDAAAVTKIEEFLKLLTEDKVVVKLGETPGVGNPATRQTGATSPAQELETAIQKTMQERKLSYGDAYSAVLAETPELGNKYLEAMR